MTTMTREPLVLTRVSTATTYHFRRDGRDFGWALCTVNDTTGELSIQSDWGSWSYRWHANPESLGAPSLTHFLADRTGVDYIARKLQSEGTKAREFSPTKTAAALRRLLAERRLEDGREQIANAWDDEFPIPPHAADRYDERGLPILSHRMPAGYRAGRPWDINGRPYEPLPYLSRDKAREIWDELGELAADLDGSRGAEPLFWERLSSIDGFDEYVTEEPWNYGETEQTTEDKILREVVLPPLIEACRARVAESAGAAEGSVS